MILRLVLYYWLDSQTCTIVSPGSGAEAREQAVEHRPPVPQAGDSHTADRRERRSTGRERHDRHPGRLLLPTLSQRTGGSRPFRRCGRSTQWIRFLLQWEPFLSGTTLLFLLLVFRTTVVVVVVVVVVFLERSASFFITIRSTPAVFVFKVDVVFVEG